MSRPLSQIALIGPYLSGKSTLRELLADALGRRQCALSPYHDEALCDRYYRAAGFTPDEANRILSVGGPDGAYDYMKPFEAYAVERCVIEHPDHIIEIGATHVVQDDALFRRVQQALQPMRNVVLLMPSADPDESYQTLRERYWALIDIDLNEVFVKHPSNHLLAKHLIYTQDRTPLQTRDDILAIVRANGGPFTPIILIGPPCTGKSTISNLLEAQLGLRAVGLDVMNFTYPPELGFDESKLHSAWEAEGLRGAWRYLQPFTAYKVEQLLREHADGIIDFGAGHSVYEDPALLSRVQAAMAPFPNVFLLLPSPDLDESIRILKYRPRGTIHGRDSNLYLIRHHAYEDLATLVVYTQGKTPEQTRDEILGRLA